MYRKVDNSLDFVKREEEILKYWEDHQIFEKQVKLHQDADKYTFYDGPPTANGKPHIGHVLTRAIKDLIPRFKSMQGHNVLRKAGWDTHGLPVEIEVEKMLGISGKEQIEAYGIEDFVEKCKESVWKYKSEWEDMSKRVGFWADMDNPYVTYEQEYIESEWWAMKKIWEKGLLYEGYRIVPYCPRCGTALASHEVAQGYEDVTENSIYVRFAVKGEENTYLAAWTTTPWTLPSNLALAVNPKVTYVLLERDEEGQTRRYYLAKELQAAVFGENPGKVLKELSGQDLAGLEYEPLFSYAKEIVANSGKKAWYVATADFVTTTEGTGIVHIAPAFGEDDNKLGKACDLPFVQFVKDDGTMPPEVKEFAGLFVKDADPQIIDWLKDQGKLIRVQAYTHSYPFCWRCHTPLIYYARNSWFVEMTKVRDELVSNNKKVNWIPPTLGEKRFGNFLENVIDWNISRERYWGMPLPVWRCPNGHDHVVGSIEELKAMSPDCPEDIELHRPYIDAVHLTCPECGELMTRIPEVADAWFDSGAMPYAQWHYPFENEDTFHDRFPADFISEAVDQTRGWFYSLTAEATLLFEQEAFENCIVLGHVQDKDGIKMSKHKGNVVNPWEAIDSEGADAVRWYFYSNSQPWLPSRFSLDAVKEDKRKFMGTLWNTYAFYVLYAEIDQFKPQDHPWDPYKVNVIDRWILSRLNTLVAQVTASLEKFDILTATQLLEKFADDLSNWYVRRNRERYWVSGMPQDKVDAYQCLYTVLVTLAKLSAPFTPFMAEMIYQNLVANLDPSAPESVHLCAYPQANETLINPEVEEQMDLVLKLVNLGRTARAQSQLKTRQPLSRMLVVGGEKLEADFADLVKDELNVKALEKADDADNLQDYHFKPQLKLLGKRFGKRLNELKEVLNNLDGVKAYKELKKQGQIEVVMEDGPEVLTEEELLIENQQAEGYSAASDYGLTVALDTTLSPELIDEGFLREIVSKIQTMRKDADFELTDRIKLYFGGTDKLMQIAQSHKESLLADVLGLDILPLDKAPAELRDKLQTWDINGEELEIILENVSH